MKTFLKFTVLSAVLLMLVGGLASCNEKNTNNYKKVCNVKNPLADLPWLREFIEIGGPFPGMLVNIYQCTYNDGAVGFLINPAFNSFYPIIELYNCEGELLDYAGWGSWEKLFEKWNVKNRELIWTNIK